MSARQVNTAIAAATAPARGRRRRVGGVLMARLCLVPPPGWFCTRGDHDGPCAATAYDSLDPGIRDIVRTLRAAGFETTDSGDGISKPEDDRVFEEPHVVSVVDVDALVAEADRLHRLLGDSWRIEASYCPNEGTAVILAYLPDEVLPTC